MKILETVNKIVKPHSSKATVIMLSAACCIPSMAPFDDRAKKIIEQAILETGIDAQFKLVPATTAMFGGGIPRKVMGELMSMFNQGKVTGPVILINGEVVSYSVPALETMKAALSKLSGKNKNE